MLQIVYKPIAGLLEYARNARTHSEQQVLQIVASIREYGWTNPVLIDEKGEIIAGHGRVLAAKRLAMEEVPCIELSGLTEAQKRAYRIADNKLPMNAGWDEELLKLELMDLQALQFPVELTGFEMPEFEAMLTPAAGSTVAMGSLVDRFGVPPFTILDARQGYWQERKRAWLALGIKSELGRSDNTMRTGGVYINQNQWRKTKGKANVAPGRHAMPATDYSKNGGRGDGHGKLMEGVR